MDARQQREQLLDYGDLLKLSLAGLLREYELETWQGARKKGRQIFYGMQPAGYCSQPWENVNYASCHDNQTLFDQVHDFCYCSATKSWSDSLHAMHGTPTIQCNNHMPIGSTLDENVNFNGNHWYTLLRDETLVPDTPATEEPLTAKVGVEQHQRAPPISSVRAAVTLAFMQQAFAAGDRKGGT